MSNRFTASRVFPWAGLAAAAALVLVLAQQHRDLSRAYDRLRLWATLLHAGNVVPTFTTLRLDGSPVTIGAAAAPETRQVLFILHTTCRYSRATLPIWARIADSLRRIATPKIELYGISLDPAESTRAYARANRLPYPVVLFPERKLMDLYRARLTPVTVVLDGGGRVLYARTGLLDSAVILDSVFHAATSPARRAGPLPWPPAGRATGGRGG